MLYSYDVLLFVIGFITIPICYVFTISVAVLVKSFSRLSAKFPLQDEICYQPLSASLLLRLFDGHMKVQSGVVQ